MTSTALPRPTTAQVNVAADLAALSRDAVIEMDNAVSLVDLDHLQEIHHSTVALEALVRSSEAWVAPALAHITESRRLLDAITRRSAAR